ASWFLSPIMSGVVSSVVFVIYRKLVLSKIATRQSRTNTTRNQAYDENRNRREKPIDRLKAAKTISLIVCIFVVCWLPSGVAFALELSKILCIAAGNILVILAVCRYHDLRTPTNTIIASLAFADFLTGCFGIPLYMFLNIFESSLPCTPMRAFLFSLPVSVTSTVSFNHILAVTADRFIAVTRPPRYHSLVTNERIKYVLLLIWIVCTVATATKLLTFVANDKMVGTIKCSGQFFVHPSSVAVSSVSLAGFLTVAIILLALNIRVLQIAMRQSRIIANQNGAFYEARNQHDARNDRLKAAKTIFLIAFAFIVCWTPAGIKEILDLCDIRGPWDNILSQGVSITLSLHPAANPLIYGFRDSKFRRAFKNLLRHALNGRS
ncbi:adenosine receptor A2b-like, partial [Diadema antillarum]|uniref:adenosine receptor A2b-like n=1 Tax=Diadema antillarum TaxID=105358 RepID=UPI003A8AC9F3